MQVTKCDSCGSIMDGYCENREQVKIYKRIWSWFESWWVTIDLCDTCYKGLKSIGARLCK